MFIHFYPRVDDEVPPSPCDEFAQGRANDEALMYQCEGCGEWHLTSAGERMDEHYADVLPMSPLIWWRGAVYPF